MQWDTSDNEPASPTSPRGAKRPPPIPVKVKDASGRPVKLPGVAQRQEAAPVSPGGRARRDTQPMANPDLQFTAQSAQNKQVPGERTFDVFIPGAGVYRVPAESTQQATDRVLEYIAGGGDPDVGNIPVDPGKVRTTPSPTHEGATCADGVGGHQEPVEEAYFRTLKEAIRSMVREVVRKKEGGGGYQLYAPNKGKKKSAKPVGEFPTRLAAKRAELARFPPKDPEQLKKARKRIEKVLKDPKKRAEAERKEMSAKTPHKKGRPAGDRKKAKREALIAAMTRNLQERLFHEDEVPGSPWDEKIGNLHPDVIASDKTLAKHHKNLASAANWSLGDAGKTLGKVLRGMAKVNPGDISVDPNRQKTFMPVMLDCDGVEIGPVHLYVDGGHVKIEVSQDARDAIAALDPVQARDLRGGLMSFQEDHLPKIDYAKKAWNERDSYLDKLHGRLEKQHSGLSGVEHHILKQLMAKGSKRR